MAITILLIAIAYGVIVLDQASKLLIFYTMEIGQEIEILPGFFRLHYITNPGMSFGLFGGENQRWIFMILSPIALIAIGVYLFRFSKDRLPMKIGLSFILAGGFSNMIDRIFYGDKLFHGEVIDVFDFYGIWNAIFNVADSFVCIGAALVICSLLYDIIKEKRDKKQEAVKKAEELNEKMSGTDITPSAEENKDIKITKPNGLDNTKPKSEENRDS